MYSSFVNFNNKEWGRQGRRSHSPPEPTGFQNQFEWYEQSRFDWESGEMA